MVPVSLNVYGNKIKHGRKMTKKQAAARAIFAAAAKAKNKNSKGKARESDKAEKAQLSQ